MDLQDIREHPGHPPSGPQDQDVGKQHADEDRSDQVGRGDENQGTGPNVVHQKHAKQDQCNRRPRNTQGQQRDHGAAGGGIVGGFRGGDALLHAGAEFLRVRRRLAGDAIGQINGEDGPQPRQNAGKGADEKRPEHRKFHSPDVGQAHPLGLELTDHGLARPDCRL